MSIYSKEFKEEAIRLSDEIGNKKAAAQLGIPYYTLADWRNHSKHKPKGTATMSEEELRIRNRELERENAELREANNILKDALGFLLELSSQVQRFFEKNFFRRPPAQRFTWAPVQKRSDGIHIRLSNLGKGGAFRKELTQ